MPNSRRQPVRIRRPSLVLVARCVDESAQSPFYEWYVETLVATTQRKNNKLSILMLDLDQFKIVNDTYGHDAGDSVLKIIARILALQVRTSDLVVRYGGGEFLIILQEDRGYSGFKLAEKIRAVVADTKIQVPGITL